MFKPKKSPETDHDLRDRVAYLEGLTTGFLHYSSNRVHILNALRDKLPEGSVERGLVDLLFTLERDSYAKTFALEVTGEQEAGHEAFISTMSRALRQ